MVPADDEQGKNDILANKGADRHYRALSVCHSPNAMENLRQGKKTKPTKKVPSFAAVNSGQPVHTAHHCAHCLHLALVRAATSREHDCADCPSVWFAHLAVECGAHLQISHSSFSSFGFFIFSFPSSQLLLHTCCFNNFI